MNPSSELTELEEITLELERIRDRQMRDAFGDALSDEGDMVYVRLIGGRLTWIKAVVHGGASWKELTPELAKRGGLTTPVQKGKTLGAEEVEAVLIQEPESYEIGWYQDVKGDLYQFDGETWVGKTPTKKQKDDLEFLG